MKSDIEIFKAEYWIVATRNNGLKYADDPIYLRFEDMPEDSKNVDFGEGWFWAHKNNEPTGPFDTEKEAMQNALENNPYYEE